MISFKMLYLLRLLAVLLLAETSNSVEFIIKHKMSGKFIHPYNSNQNITDNNPLVVYNGYYDNIFMAFDIVDGEWGYLRHVNSGKIIIPSDASMTPGDDTRVVLHSDRRPWAYFAIDQVNDRIIHHGGKYIHPLGDSAWPADETFTVLNGVVNEYMEFQLVNTSNPKEDIFPYGDAQIVGEWKLVFSVENPMATQTEKYEIVIGKSESESTTDSFQFVWEADTGANFWFAHMSTDVSIKDEIQATSSETWHAETKTTYEITVVRGEPVAVWQKHYIGEQHGHKGVHKSNMFAHTTSPHRKPDDSAYMHYHVI